MEMLSHNQTPLLRATPIPAENQALVKALPVHPAGDRHDGEWRHSLPIWDVVTVVQSNHQVALSRLCLDATGRGGTGSGTDTRHQTFGFVHRTAAAGGPGRCWHYRWSPWLRVLPYKAAL